VFSTDMTLPSDAQLHNSRVSSLRLPSSSADLHVPYLRRPNKDLLDDAVEQWAKICGAEVRSSVEQLEEGKNVLNVDLAQGQGELATRMIFDFAHV